MLLFIIILLILLPVFGYIGSKIADKKNIPY